MSEFSEGGFFLSPLGGNRNLIRAEIAEEFRRALNALGKIEFQESTKSEYKVVYSDGRIALVVPTVPENSVVVSVQRAQIATIGQDIITVALWDDDAENFSGSVSVAKPPHLRGSLASETSWSTAWTYSYTGADYQERTRAATGLSATKERVNIPYRATDEIFVVDTGAATGVEGVTYIDLNIAARQWWTETQGCDPGTGDPLYTFMPRGPWNAVAVGSNFA